MDDLTYRILEVIDKSVQDPMNNRRSTWTWAARFRLADEIAAYVRKRDAERALKKVQSGMA